MAARDRDPTPGHGIVRVIGAAQFVCFAGSAAALTQPQVPFTRDGRYLAGTTIYPWWTWALIAGGALAGLVALVAGVRAPVVRLAAGAAGFVAGAQLAGTGLVAHKHWEPAFGMGGGFGDYAHVDTYKRLALLVAVLGGLAAVAAIGQLWAAGAFDRRAGKAVVGAFMAVGIAVIVAAPPALMAGEGASAAPRLWGAMGLVYAGPWGMSVILAGWVSRPAAIALSVAVLGSVAAVAVGPQMVDLLANAPTTVCAAIAAAIAALTVLRSAVRDSHVQVT
jgi:hypothetical protein